MEDINQLEPSESKDDDSCVVDNKQQSILSFFKPVSRKPVNLSKKGASCSSELGIEITKKKTKANGLTENDKDKSKLITDSCGTKESKEGFEETNNVKKKTKNKKQEKKSRKIKDNDIEDSSKGQCQVVEGNKNYSDKVDLDIIESTQHIKSRRRKKGKNADEIKEEGFSKDSEPSIIISHEIDGEKEKPFDAASNFDLNKEHNSKLRKNKKKKKRKTNIESDSDEEMLKSIDFQVEHKVNESKDGAEIVGEKEKEVEDASSYDAKNYQNSKHRKKTKNRKTNRESDLHEEKHEHNDLGVEHRRNEFEDDAEIIGEEKKEIDDANGLNKTRNSKRRRKKKNRKTNIESDSDEEMLKSIDFQVEHKVNESKDGAEIVGEKEKEVEDASSYDAKNYQNSKHRKKTKNRKTNTESDLHEEKHEHNDLGFEHRPIEIEDDAEIIGEEKKEIDDANSFGLNKTRNSKRRRKKKNRKTNIESDSDEEMLKSIDFQVEHKVNESKDGAEIVGEREKEVEDASGYDAKNYQNSKHRKKTKNRKTNRESDLHEEKHEHNDLGVEHRPNEIEDDAEIIGEEKKEIDDANSFGLNKTRNSKRRKKKKNRKTNIESDSDKETHESFDIGVQHKANIVADHSTGSKVECGLEENSYPGEDDAEEYLKTPKYNYRNDRKKKRKMSSATDPDEQIGVNNDIPDEDEHPKALMEHKIGSRKEHIFKSRHTKKRKKKDKSDRDDNLPGENDAKEDGESPSSRDKKEKKDGKVKIKDESEEDQYQNEENAAECVTKLNADEKRVENESSQMDKVEGRRSSRLRQKEVRYVIDEDQYDHDMQVQNKTIGHADKKKVNVEAKLIDHEKKKLNAGSKEMRDNLELEKSSEKSSDTGICSKDNHSNMNLGSIKKAKIISKAEDSGSIVLETASQEAVTLSKTNFLAKFAKQKIVRQEETALLESEPCLPVVSHVAQISEMENIWYKKQPGTVILRTVSYRGEKTSEENKILPTSLDWTFLIQPLKPSARKIMINDAKSMSVTDCLCEIVKRNPDFPVISVLKMYIDCQMKVLKQCVAKAELTRSNLKIIWERQEKVEPLIATNAAVALSNVCPMKPAIDIRNMFGKAKVKKIKEKTDDCEIDDNEEKTASVKVIVESFGKDKTDSKLEGKKRSKKEKKLKAKSLGKKSKHDSSIELLDEDESSATRAGTIEESFTKVSRRVRKTKEECQTKGELGDPVDDSGRRRSRRKIERLDYEEDVVDFDKDEDGKAEKERNRRKGACDKENIKAVFDLDDGGACEDRKQRKKKLKKKKKVSLVDVEVEETKDDKNIEAVDVEGDEKSKRKSKKKKRKKERKSKENDEEDAVTVEKGPADLDGKPVKPGNRDIRMLFCSSKSCSIQMMKKNEKEDKEILDACHGKGDSSLELLPTPTDEKNVDILKEYVDDDKNAGDKNVEPEVPNGIDIRRFFGNSFVKGSECKEAKEGGETEGREGAVVTKSEGICDDSFCIIEQNDSCKIDDTLLKENTNCKELFLGNTEIIKRKRDKKRKSKITAADQQKNEGVDDSFITIDTSANASIEVGQSIDERDVTEKEELPTLERPMSIASYFKPSARKANIERPPDVANSAQGEKEMIGNKNINGEEMSLAIREDINELINVSSNKCSSTSTVKNTLISDKVIEEETEPHSEIFSIHSRSKRKRDSNSVSEPPSDIKLTPENVLLASPALHFPSKKAKRQKIVATVNTSSQNREEITKDLSVSDKEEKSSVLGGDFIDEGTGLHCRKANIAQALQEGSCLEDELDIYKASNEGIRNEEKVNMKQRADEETVSQGLEDHVPIKDGDSSASDMDDPVMMFHQGNIDIEAVSDSEATEKCVAVCYTKYSVDVSEGEVRSKDENSSMNIEISQQDGDNRAQECRVESEIERDDENDVSKEENERLKQKVELTLERGEGMRENKKAVAKERKRKKRSDVVEPTSVEEESGYRRSSRVRRKEELRLAEKKQRLAEEESRKMSAIRETDLNEICESPKVKRRRKYRKLSERSDEIPGSSNNPSDDSLELLDAPVTCKSANQASASALSTQSVHTGGKVCEDQKKCFEMQPVTEDFVNATLQWTEKYAPMKHEHVIGNHDHAEQIFDWLSSWKEKHEHFVMKIMTSRASRARGKNDEDDSNFDDSDDDDDSLSNTFVIIGKVGCGSTAAVQACALELGYKVLEVNPSSYRSGKQIQALLGEATQSHQVKRKFHGSAVENNGKNNDNSSGAKNLGSFFGAKPAVKTDEEAGVDDKKNVPEEKSDSSETLKDSSQTGMGGDMSLILLEQADIVFDEHDRGFWFGVNELRKESKRPIIITANNSFVTSKLDGGSYELVTMAIVDSETIVKHLQAICLAERVMPARQLIERVVRNCNGDIRKSIMKLQFMLERWRKPCYKALNRSAIKILDDGDDALSCKEDATSVANESSCKQPKVENMDLMEVQETKNNDREIAGALQEEVQAKKEGNHSSPDVIPNVADIKIEVIENNDLKIGNDTGYADKVDSEMKIGKNDGMEITKEGNDVVLNKDDDLEDSDPDVIIVEEMGDQIVYGTEEDLFDVSKIDKEKLFSCQFEPHFSVCKKKSNSLKKASDCSLSLEMIASSAEQLSLLNTCCNSVRLLRDANTHAFGWWNAEISDGIADEERLFTYPELDAVSEEWFAQTNNAFNRIHGDCMQDSQMGLSAGRSENSKISTIFNSVENPLPSSGKMDHRAFCVDTLPALSIICKSEENRKNTEFGRRSRRFLHYLDTVSLHLDPGLREQFMRNSIG